MRGLNRRETAWTSQTIGAKRPITTFNGRADALPLPRPATAADPAEVLPAEDDAFPSWDKLAAATENPAASINCGFTKQGLPIGLQIVGPRFADLTVLRIAKLYETWRGPIMQWPQPTKAPARA